MEGTESLDLAAVANDLLPRGFDDVGEDDLLSHFLNRLRGDAPATKGSRGRAGGAHGAARAEGAAGGGGDAAAPNTIAGGTDTHRERAGGGEDQKKQRERPPHGGQGGA